MFDKLPKINVHNLYLAFEVFLCNYFSAAKQLSENDSKNRKIRENAFELMKTNFMLFV